MLPYLIALILLLQPALTPNECAVTLEFSYRFENTDEIRVITSDAESLSFMGQKVLMDYTIAPVREGTTLNWSIKGNGDFSITYRIVSERYELKDFSGTIHEVPEDIKARYLGKNVLSVGGADIDFIDPGNQDIRNKAREIAGDDESVYGISRKLYQWIVENVGYNTRAETYPQGAAETLRKRSGDCDEQAALFISMARSLGVPCFYMDGYVIDREGTYDAGHTWAGVIKYNEYGYEIFPVDTVYRELGVKRANKVFVDYDNGSEGYINSIYNDVRYWYNDSGKVDIEYRVRCTDYITSSYPFYGSMKEKRYF
jgi:hypothetical protein